MARTKASSSSASSVQSSATIGFEAIQPVLKGFAWVKHCIRNAAAAANRELIARFEQKIQTTLGRIWGGAAPIAPQT